MAKGKKQADPNRKKRALPLALKVWLEVTQEMRAKGKFEKLPKKGTEAHATLRRKYEQRMAEHKS